MPSSVKEHEDTQKVTPNATMVIFNFLIIVIFLVGDVILRDKYNKSNNKYNYTNIILTLYCVTSPERCGIESVLPDFKLPNFWWIQDSTIMKVPNPKV